MGQRRINSGMCHKPYSELQTHPRSGLQSEPHCPVCLQIPSYPVETNCGHSFCGSCLIEYWRHGSWLGAVGCPLCRQKVNFLNILFCEGHQEERGTSIARDIRDYNKRCSGQPRPFADYIYDTPLVLQMAFRELFTMSGLVWIFCVRIAICSFGAVLCLTSPLDGIPEAFGAILGAVDDLAVVFLLLICVINICQQMGPERASLARSLTPESL
ncbi:E3 ubiquitin-protein ligase RNF170-like [Callorhinchus milii]|uniref:E3 ubiquitin-protein ligase RNF170-like n=1 Tax=Callorhinchus milii TaxID=7868 RepID=UPI00045760AD|nr:E3 ubiquitin-protein ligase RNF170-like [Callorhinchus milii]XP_007901881.1 E3 ubiquitin-protein ligase RNF170-like [Callorhinchus milii]XP_007901882.1 E3 ubiquitin-protein ligase RNF170-like [Callorhinchus milii]|eukprot:gi/632970858/ref/XP_007901880.1/ PREDICTED: E3 ubiquitin-protein ligase RNF170-like [Callorhinchus milii]